MKVFESLEARIKKLKPILDKIPMDEVVRDIREDRESR
jgi:hypothetical protein